MSLPFADKTVKLEFIPAKPADAHQNEAAIRLEVALMGDPVYDLIFPGLTRVLYRI